MRKTEGLQRQADNFIINVGPNIILSVQWLGYVLGDLGSIPS
jgi:hypothetical protein